MRLLLSFGLCFVMAGCGALSPQTSKATAMGVAAKRLKCSKKKLKSRLLKGGSGKFGLVSTKYYAVSGCKKKTCIECDKKCVVYERKTKDKCPPGLVR